MSDIEHSSADEEDKTQDHTYWQFGETSDAAQGRWAQGSPLVDPQQPIIYQAEPVGSDDVGLLPPPDPQLFATDDGSNGPGTSGTGGGAYAGGIASVVNKVKNALE